MSYSRDRDMATRGVGAIASRDYAHPRAALARAAARARATAAHDRRLAGMTYGARGGLGAVSTLNTVTGMTGGLRRPTIVEGGTIEGGSTRPYEGGGKIPPGTPRAPIVGKWKDPNLTKGYRPPATAFVPDSKLSTSSPETPPVVVDIKPPTKKPVTPLVSGGGGGGVSLPPKTAPTPLPELEQVEIPDVPEAVDPGPSAAPASSKRNLLILAGAVGLAAIILLRDKD